MMGFLVGLVVASGLLHPRRAHGRIVSTGWGLFGLSDAMLLVEWKRKKPKRQRVQDYRPAVAIGYVCVYDGCVCACVYVCV